MPIIHKSLLFVKIHDSPQWPDPDTDSQNLPATRDFLATLHAIVLHQHGTVHKWLPRAAMAIFDQALPALLAAIAIQEELDCQRAAGHLRLHCKIGIATGPATLCAMPDGSLDYLGAVVEQALRLTEQAHGNAIILDTHTHRAVQTPCDQHPELWSGSRAGREQNRPFAAYFQRIPPFAFSHYPHPDLFALFWQAHDAGYVTAHPVAPQTPPFRRPTPVNHPTVRPAGNETTAAANSASPTPRPPTTDLPPHLPFSGMRYFGKVTAFKKERGFGFIQFYTEHDQYAEIYVHMTYVISQTSLKEHDHVHFAIQPGKGGRPQACSVLIMGSRMQGDVESLDADGGGRIAIRDHDGNPIRFYILPGQLRDPGIVAGDRVTFTVGSGSESEGLIATEVTPPGGRTTVEPAIADDDLGIGDTEQAIVTTYFADKGYGFAKCRRNNIYLHVSELVNPEEVLRQGDMISFHVSPGRDGTYRAQEIHKVSRHDLIAEG
ncbi:MAG: cold shock domain-containing protein [Magnetococcales bacterium]|nr:cold shock domain-containing protein [Magnetococcales bacterium]